MERSDKHSRSDSPLHRGRIAELAAPHQPGWALLARHRKPGSRLRMFHWPFGGHKPDIDNSLPERLEQGIGLLSRALGPILLVAALIGTGWGLAFLVD